MVIGIVYRYGCDFRSPRKAMTEHMKQRVDHHLNCILNYTGNLERMCINLHSKYSQLEHKMETMCRISSISSEGNFTGYKECSLSN